MIFSVKALIYTVIGAVIGLISMLILGKILGIIITAILALLGFGIGTLKMPKIESLDVCRRTAGENIDDVIRRGIKFKLKKNRIYVYTKEENDNVNK